MTMTSSELPRLKQSKAIPPVSLKKAGRVAYKPAAAPVSAEEAARRQKSLAAEGALLSLLTVLNEAAMTDTELQVTLQAVKAALFARDYTLAFSRPDYLRAYCARWVPGRALAWRDLLLDSDTFVSACQKKALSSPEEPYRAVCIGGGAGSEVLALASVAKELLSDLQLGLRVEAVDIADWGPLLHDMEALARSRWKLSDDAFALRFSHADVLDAYAGIDFASADLVTLFFTTNELFAASKPKTLALLSHFGAACKPGALLCVAESAGSYSEITFGDKTYPLDLILDQTLAARGKPWRIAEKSQSRWYRVPEETRSRYKLQLENTHMMVRVYQKRVPEKVSPIADST